MSKDLTARQREILDYLIETIRAQGYPPTFREIMQRFQLRSTQGVTRHLDALEKKGWIQRSPGARSLTLNPALQEPNRATPFRRVPLIGEVPAGRPMIATEDVEDHLPISEEWLHPSDRSFLLRVRGRSMAEGIQPGDLVLVEPAAEAQRDEIVVAMIEDEATLKRYLPERDRVILRSDNPEFADLIVRRDFRLVGRVTALIRRYR